MHWLSNIRFFLPGLFLFVRLFSSGQHITPYHGPFTQPPGNKNLLFYLHRTIDADPVVYEINYKPDGSVDRHKPVKIYWINSSSKKTAPLTFAQNKFAYGIESEETKEHGAEFKINLVSYKKIHMYLKKDAGDGTYRVHVSINGQPGILTGILVNITGGTYLKPRVSYIELTGRHQQSGQTITEKIETGK